MRHSYNNVTETTNVVEKSFYNETNKKKKKKDIETAKKKQNIIPIQN